MMHDINHAIFVFVYQLPIVRGLRWLASPGSGRGVSE
jgi:hypothetical protein